MKVSRAILAALLVLGAFSLAAKGADAADTPPAGNPQAGGVPEARYETRADCWPGLPTDKASRDRMECGVLHVPELRDGRPTRMLELAVVRVRGRESWGYPPIIYLHGGPGGDSIGSADHLLDSSLTADHDMILLDQRGGGLSHPTVCPDIPNSVTIPEAPGLLADCVRTLRAAGGDPSGYTPLAIAADVDDLRRALGYGRVNLFASSYGTVIAQILMATRPETLSGVVLDSAFPVFVPHLDGEAQVVSYLEGVLRDCAADAACAAAYPDLERRFLDALDALTASQPGRRKRFDGKDALTAIFLLLYAPDTRPIAPFILNKVAEHGTEPLENMARAFGMEDIVGMGAYFAVSCSVIDAAADGARLAEVVAAAPRFRPHLSGDAILRTCAAWPVRVSLPVPDGSGVPTLIVQGADDPITPPVYAQMLAPRLADARVLIVPRQSHGPSTVDACAEGAVAAFFVDPAAASREPSCGQAGPARFLIPDILVNPALAALLMGPLWLPAVVTGALAGLALFPVSVWLSIRLLRAPGTILASTGGPAALALFLSGLLVLAAFLGLVAVVRENVVLAAFGLPPWMSPALALPWAIPPLVLLALFRWVRWPDAAPQGPWGKLWLGLSLLLAGLTALFALTHGLALGL